VPGAHSWHSDAPDSEDEPSPHAKQNPWPLAFEYVPALHGRQVDSSCAPIAALNVPAGQDVQFLVGPSPPPGPYVPGPHSAQFGTAVVHLRETANMAKQLLNSLLLVGAFMFAFYVQRKRRGNLLRSKRWSAEEIKLAN